MYDEMRVLVKFLVDTFPLAYYGAFVTLVVSAAFLLLWGIDVLLDGLIRQFIRVIKPLAFVSVVLAMTFLLFIATVIMDNPKALNRAMSGRTVQRLAGAAPAPARINGNAGGGSLTPDAKHANGAGNAVVPKDGGAQSDQTPKRISPAVAKPVSPAERPLDFSFDSVKKTLEKDGFMAKPAIAGRYPGTETYDRRFGEDMLAVSIRADNGVLRRITFYFSRDDAGRFGSAVDSYVKQFCETHLSPIIRDIDGVLHAKNWTPARVKQAGDFFLVKATDKRTGSPSRFIIIHKDDPLKNAATTDRLAAKQAGTNWSAFNTWFPSPPGVTRSARSTPVNRKPVRGESKPRGVLMTPRVNNRRHAAPPVRER